MLILRQKSFLFCTPHLKTPQTALPYWPGYIAEWKITVAKRRFRKISFFAGIAVCEQLHTVSFD